jgi:peptide/nickel transport system permease protein
VFVGVVTILRAAETACVVRGRVAQVLVEDFVAAARALGAPPFRVLIRHVAPHVIFTAVTSAVLGTASGIGLEAAAGLVGLGPGAAPSWGEALSRGISNGQWGVAAAAAAGILVTVSALWIAARVLERSVRVVPRNL